MRRSAFSERVRFNRVWLFLGWTLLLWTSRLRNVLGNADLDDGQVAARVAVVVVFVGLALLAAYEHRRQKGTRTLRLLVAWTMGFWVVRGVGIVLDDHSLGFIAVHAVLMVVSIGLAMWVWLRRAR